MPLRAGVNPEDVPVVAKRFRILGFLLACGTQAEQRIDKTLLQFNTVEKQPIVVQFRKQIASV